MWCPISITPSLSCNGIRAHILAIQNAHQPHHISWLGKRPTVRHTPQRERNVYDARHLYSLHNCRKQWTSPSRKRDNQNPPMVSANTIIPTMAALDLFKSSFLVMSLLLWTWIQAGSVDAVFPPTCKRIECPGYDVIDTGNGFEIRRYNSSMWMSTRPIDDVSFVAATRTGFLQLFDYIQGKNDNHEKIEMTAPVITEVKPSDGPFCASSFVVSFYVPKKNQGNPPSAKGLHLQKWGVTHLAVSQFSGFVADEDIGEQAAALYASVSGTVWGNAINKSHSSESKTEYIVAQYNSPFEFQNRVNEIWLTFEWDGIFAG